MSTTYSLDNLLVDDPSIDREALLGPIVPMRWMNNLCRLALLEEFDRLRAEAGESAEHESEIRRLRRMSMHPSAGRNYPVDGEINRSFQSIEMEQAALIVDHFLARQPMPLDNGNDHPKAESPHCFPAQEHIPVAEDPDSEYRFEPESADAWSDLLEIAEVMAGESSGCPTASTLMVEPRTLYESRAVQYPNNDGPAYQNSNVENDNVESNNAHNHREYDFNEPSSVEDSQRRGLDGSRIARMVATVAIMLLAVLLGLAANGFIKAHIQPTAPQTSPVRILSQARIVPSAVPSTRNAKHETPGLPIRRRTPAEP